MRSQSQRVPIVSPLEKNYESPENQSELDFSDDKPEPSFADAQPEVLDFSTQNTSVKPTNSFNQNPTDDDLSPETLIHEDGALSPHERGKGKPTDQRFTIVDEREIGGGSGLDEAELAHIQPLDGKTWDENQSQLNNSQPSLVFSPELHNYRAKKHS